MLDRLERIAGAAGGYAELRLHRNTSRVVVMRQSAVIENRSTSLAGASARCFESSLLAAGLPTLSVCPEISMRALFLWVKNSTT